MTGVFALLGLALLVIAMITVAFRSSKILLGLLNRLFDWIERKLT